MQRGETGNRAPCEHTCSGSSLHLSYLVHLLGIILLLALSLDIYYSGQNQPKAECSLLLNPWLFRIPAPLCASLQLGFVS